MARTSCNRVPTTLQAPIQYPSLAMSDSNGDGLTDVYFRLINSTAGSDNYLGVPASDLGPYVARNRTARPTC